MITTRGLLLALVALVWVWLAVASAQVSPPGPLPGQVNQPRINQPGQPNVGMPTSLATPPFPTVIASRTPEGMTPGIPTPGLPDNAHPDSGGLH